MTKPLTIFGTHDDKTIAQINRCLEDDRAVAGVLCADGHLGYSQPVGGVIAYRDALSISGVGFDIACGNKGVKLNLKGSDISKSQWASIADEMEKRISFGVGRSSVEFADHPLFEDDVWRLEPFKKLKQKAREQLSSCGAGNHYADVFIDQEDSVWIGVHFGSRGLGHSIATHFLAAAGGKDSIDAAPCVIPVNSSLGEDYMEGVRIAGLYAYAGRDIVVDLITQILGGKIIDEVHNNHNSFWRETINGEELIVVRKGASPAAPGQRSFVGGSMGGLSAIVEGVESPLSQKALYSTVHGAGRLMSRTEAAGKSKWIFNAEAGRKIKTRISDGKINPIDMRKQIAAAGIELRGGGADEAPAAYRRLEDVLESHRETIKVTSFLTPRVVVMAADGVFDPYKD